MYKYLHGNIAKAIRRLEIPDINICAKKSTNFCFNKVDKSRCYKILGDKVDVGQGCIFVGNPNQTLLSYGFDTCSPFVMMTNENNKRILGHIDSMTDAEEIVQAVKNNFAPKEIENATFHYFKGAETLSPGENLGRFAMNTIEDALSLLKVKGEYHGQLKTGFEDIMLTSKGLFVKDNLTETKIC